MADEADRSDESILAKVSEAIARAAAEVRAMEEERGENKSCRWCDDPTDGGAKFCSAECSKDWHTHQAALKRNGIRR